MILSAGLGTRLRPLTERWPKPAMPFLGVPLFRYHLEVLRAAGVGEVGINTHHLGEVMLEVAQAECDQVGMSLTVVHEPVIQGTGGGIRGLRDFLAASDPFVVLNGDILFPLDVRGAVEAHRGSGADATMVLQALPLGERYAAVEMDASRRVRRIAGLGPGGEGLTPWHFTGVHVMRPRVFDFMSPSGPEDINREVYLRLLQAGGHLGGHVAPGYWSDLGTPSRYLATVNDVLEGRASGVYLGSLAGVVRGPGTSWVHPSARLEGAVVRGPTVIDADATLEEGVVVGAGVYVGRGAVVGRGARLERCAVMEETTVSPGEQLTEVLAWRHHRIAAPL